MAKNTKVKINDFNRELCELKHETIDKDIKELKNENKEDHNEIKVLIEKLSKDIEDNIEKNYNNLKNKIILSEQKIGSHIDELDEFDDKLKGNGTPGVREEIRGIKEDIKITKRIFYGIVSILTTIVVVFAIIALGGNWHGVSKTALQDKTSDTPHIHPSDITKDATPIIINKMEK